MCFFLIKMESNITQIEELVNRGYLKDYEVISPEQLVTLDFKAKDLIRKENFLLGALNKLIAAFNYQKRGEHFEAGFQFGHACKALRKHGGLEHYGLLCRIKELEIQEYRAAKKDELADLEAGFLENLKSMKKGLELLCQSKNADSLSPEEQGDFYLNSSDFSTALKCYRQAFKAVSDDEESTARIAHKINYLAEKRNGQKTR